MRMTKILALLLLLAVASAPIAGAQSASLLPPTEGDLVPGALAVPAKAALPYAVSRDAVTFSWALDGEKALDAAPHAFVQASREYWLEVSAAELARGVDLHTHGAAALVRINPAPRVAAKNIALDALAIEPASLELVANGVPMKDGAGMELLVDAATLKGTDAPFVEGTSAFRIEASLGAGAFTLRAPRLTAPAETPYVVHVFDRGSDVTLALTTGTADALRGDGVALRANLGGVDDVTIDAFVSSPAGQTWPVMLERGVDGGFHGLFRSDVAVAAGPGLWQLHAAASGRVGELQVVRAARVPFSLAVPTARLTGSVSIDRTGGGFAAGLGVETATAGRYEVRGVLYGTGARGLEPLAVAHSAAWLDAGTGTLALRFDPETLGDGSVGAPYEVRDLRLIDQGRMGLLQRQVRGLIVE